MNTTTTGALNGVSSEGSTSSSSSVTGARGSSESSGSSSKIFSSSDSSAQVLDKKRLGELVKEVDPCEQLDEDVEDMLLHIADDFIEQTISASCALAKHRKAATIDVKDVQLVLGMNSL